MGEVIFKHVTENSSGELWQLVSFYQVHWAPVEKSFILISQVGSTCTWRALCVETSRVCNLALSSVIYERVV